MSDLSERTLDRELVMLVRTLERMTTRVELAFNPEIDKVRLKVAMRRSFWHS